MIAIIQAGGFGTRLKSVTGDLPKPLVPLLGRPAIFRLVDWLKKYSYISKVIVLAGYRGEVVKDALKQEFGDYVLTLIESEPLGSGGCLRLVENLIGEETAILIGGDLYIELNLDSLLKKHNELKCEVTLTIQGNNHPLDADLVEPDNNFNFVKSFFTRPHSPQLNTYNLVNSAIIMISSNFWRKVKIEGKLSFEQDILLPYSKNNMIGIFEAKEFIQDLGTPERLKAAESWLSRSASENPKYLILSSEIWIHLLESISSKYQMIIDDLKLHSNKNTFIGLANNSSLPQELQWKIEMILGLHGIKTSWRELTPGTTLEMSRKKMAEKYEINFSDIIVYNHFNLE